MLLLVGGRMSEMPSSGYRLIDIPEPRQTLVHVHPGAEELGRLYRPTLAINASPTAFAAALEGLQPPNDASRGAPRRAPPTTAYRAWSTPVTNPGPVQLGRDRRLAPRPAARRCDRHQRRRQLLRAGFTASSAFAATAPSSRRPPARWATACRRRSPRSSATRSAPSSCFAGDGCFQMTSQEFATAVQYGAAVIVVVVNNGIHGTIRMHQERDYPGRVIATDLVDPGFRRARPRPRRPWRDGRDDGGVRARLRARASPPASPRSSRSSSIPRRSPPPRRCPASRQEPALGEGGLRLFDRGVAEEHFGVDLMNSTPRAIGRSPSQALSLRFAAGRCRAPSALATERPALMRTMTCRKTFSGLPSAMR